MHTATSNTRTDLNRKIYLSDQCGSSSTFIFPVGWKYALGFVVASKTVDSALDKNQSEFRVGVLQKKKKNKENSVNFP